MKKVFGYNPNLPCHKVEAFSHCSGVILLPVFPAVAFPLSKAPPCSCGCCEQWGLSIWGMQVLQAQCPLPLPLWEGLPAWGVLSICPLLEHLPRGSTAQLKPCVPTESLGTDGHVSQQPGATQGTHLSLAASSSARLLRSSGILPASQLAWQKVSLGCLEGYRSVTPAWAGAEAVVQHNEGLGGSWELFPALPGSTFSSDWNFAPFTLCWQLCARVLCVDATGAMVQHCPHLRTPLQVAGAQPGPAWFCGRVHLVATAEAALGNEWQGGLGCVPAVLLPALLAPWQPALAQ